MPEPVSHQSYGSRTPVYDDKVLDFMWQSYGVVRNTAGLP